MNDAEFFHRSLDPGFLQMREFIERFAVQSTPDFDADDWMDLFEKAVRGDMISQQMFLHLFDTYVVPSAPPDFQEMYRKERDL